MSSFAVSDVHAQYLLFREAADDLLRPGDHLYVLGDAIDGGPDSYSMLKFLLYESHPFEVSYLCGNHEMMLADLLGKTLSAAASKGITNIDEFWEMLPDMEYEYYNYRGNRGLSTINALKFNLRSIDEIKDLYIRLSALPFHIVTDLNGRKFYLVHGSPAFIDCEDMLWKRADVVNDYSVYGDYVVFGHTMTWHYMTEHSGDNQMSVYYGINRIGIDTGAEVPELGGRMSFLRLDDLRAFYYDIH